jgi:uncharacterized protein (TIGR03083 family)
VLGFLPTLGAADWDRPTVCTGWSVKDVAAHLVSNELAFGRIYRGEATEAAELDADSSVERWRTSDGETVRYSLWHHGSATQRVMDSRPDAFWRKSASSFGAGLELRHLLRLHFYELAVHSHDLTAALDAPHLWEGRVAPLVEYCVRNAPWALRKHSAIARLDVRIPEVGEWALSGDGEAWRIQPGPAGDATAGLETDAETLILLTAGRMPLEEGLARSKTTGKDATLQDVLGAWQLA